ncbi:hypothetical protein CALCODRAFT_91285 [Calocera cornea HHB12733]|uniref:Uncharacterized protein n=1 Tax=Calocera cornea HHB12733 TaxID=1353952 RepID=A0A165DAV7_9BASI|nr:hypothetical protein CALCODRAFT_91285 [Calocera cornea HHB12733]
MPGIEVFENASLVIPTPCSLTARIRTMVTPHVSLIAHFLVFLLLSNHITAQDPAAAAAAGLSACANDGDCASDLPFCAPDGFCGDAGAACTTNSQCFDSCGTDGTCGGLNAVCTTTSPSDYAGVKCDSTGFTCDTGTGTCAAAGPGPSQRRRRSDAWWAAQACSASEETACIENGRPECTDLRRDFRNCGACFNDCGDVDGAAIVGCVQGACVVELPPRMDTDRRRL